MFGLKSNLRSMLKSMFSSTLSPVFKGLKGVFKMATKKMRDEAKLQLLRETIKRFKILREEKLLKKARSFKEFLQYVAMIKAREILGNFGYAGSEKLNYYPFIRACIRDYVRYVLTWERYTSLKEVQKAIDTIFDYYEFWWVERLHLDKKVVAELERMMVELFLDVRKYMHDWEYIIEQREKEEAISQHK